MDKFPGPSSSKDRFAIQHDILYNELEVLLSEAQRRYIKVPFAGESHTSIEVRFPQHEYSFLVRVLPDYPNVAPVFLGIDSLMLSASYEKLDAINIFRQCLKDTFEPGSLCFGTLIETLEARYQEDNISDPTTDDKQKRMTASSSSDRDVETYAQDLLQSVTCAICLESLNKFDGAVLPCNHTYCCQCLQDSVEPMLAAQSAIRCCGRILPLQVIRDYCILPQKTLNAYEDLLEEFVTPRPIYCSRPACGKFIPPRYIEKDIATCRFCKRRTCIWCRKRGYDGCCFVDLELEMRRSGGWKRCPRCNHVIERISGCSHMTCVCGQAFCYDCEKKRRVWNSEFDTDNKGEWCRCSISGHAV